jgi:hypothetical protein
MIMNLPSYEEYEKPFLKDMAIELGFSDNTELAFVERLLLANSDLGTWERLADVLRDNLIAGAKMKMPILLRFCAIAGIRQFVRSWLRWVVLN